MLLMKVLHNSCNMYTLALTDNVRPAALVSQITCAHATNITYSLPFNGSVLYYGGV